MIRVTLESRGFVIKVILLARPLKYLGGLMIRVIVLARPPEYHMDAIFRSNWSHMDA